MVAGIRPRARCPSRSCRLGSRYVQFPPGANTRSQIGQSWLRKRHSEMLNNVQETGQISSASAPSNLEWSFRALQHITGDGASRTALGHRSFRHAVPRTATTPLRAAAGVLPPPRPRQRPSALPRPPSSRLRWTGRHRPGTLVRPLRTRLSQPGVLGQGRPAPLRYLARPCTSAKIGNCLRSSAFAHGHQREWKYT